MTQPDLVDLDLARELAAREAEERFEERLEALTAEFVEQIRRSSPYLPWLMLSEVFSDALYDRARAYVLAHEEEFME